MKKKNKRELFIKYAGFLYSIKALVHRLISMPTKSLRFYVVRLIRLFQLPHVALAVKSACTYWLGTHWYYYQWWFCKFSLLFVLSFILLILFSLFLFRSVRVSFSVRLDDLCCELIVVCSCIPNRYHSHAVAMRLPKFRVIIFGSFCFRCFQQFIST